MKISEIKNLDVANGDGVRTSVFVSGCTHRCKGCFNKVAWDFNYGQELTKELIESIIKSCEQEQISGLSILGGEPLEKENQKGVFELIKAFRDRFKDTKDIWLWTGYMFGTDIPNTENTNYILNNINYLIDGEYIDSLRNLNLKYRGSSNQRVLKLRKGRLIEEL